MVDISASGASVVIDSAETGSVLLSEFDISSPIRVSSRKFGSVVFGVNGDSFRRGVLATTAVEISCYPTSESGAEMLRMLKAHVDSNENPFTMIVLTPLYHRTFTNGHVVDAQDAPSFNGDGSQSSIRVKFEFAEEGSR